MSFDGCQATTRSPSSPPSSPSSSLVCGLERWKHLPQSAAAPQLSRCLDALLSNRLAPLRYISPDIIIIDTNSPPAPAQQNAGNRKRQSPRRVLIIWLRAEAESESQSVPVCLSASALSCLVGSWQRVTDLNNFAKRLPRPRPHPPLMYLSCVLLGNMSKRLMQTGECRAELGYRFLVTDTDSVVRLAGITSLLASAHGAGGRGPTPTISLSKVLCVPCCLVPFFPACLPSWFFPSRGPSEVFTACPLSRRCLLSLFFFFFSGSILLNARRVWIFNKSSASLTALPAFYL